MHHLPISDTEVPINDVNELYDPSKLSLIALISVCVDLLHLLSNTVYQGIYYWLNGKTVSEKMLF